ncbi:MAG: twin-arginine translocase subunit TatC [Lentisphaeraceae bacterium]|nr:twin-arginine translocase subunit TatC [Lentisphaeraceae bacterium]
MSDPDQTQEEEGLTEMGILDHLEELRWCIVRVAVILGVLFPLGVIFSNDIVDYIVGLSNVPSFIAIGPAEIFMQKFRIGFMVALYFSLPYALLQVWRFVSPGLYEQEKDMGKYAATASYILFLLGSLFGIMVIIPICLNFFSSLESQYVRYTPNLTEMVSFVLRIAAATGIASQLPVIVVLLFALGLVSIETLVRIRPWVIVVTFAVAALLTPPDVTSQLLLGGPTWLIYELSIIVCRILNIGSDEDSKKHSGLIKAAAFLALFTIVFGGAFGVWYTWNWYKTDAATALVVNSHDIEEYRKLWKTEAGPAKLAKSLEEDRTEAEQKNALTVLTENWQDEKLTDGMRQSALNFVFKPELLLTASDTGLKLDFKLDRKYNLPVNAEFYWQLKINDRSIMWPNADNNYKYTFAKEKPPETLIRENVLLTLKAAQEVLKVSEDYRLTAVLKVVKAENIDGSVAAWADEVSSKEVPHTVGNAKKE